MSNSKQYQAPLVGSSYEATILKDLKHDKSIGSSPYSLLWSRSHTAFIQFNKQRDGEGEECIWNEST